MPLTAAALVTGSNAINAAITHMQLHSGAPGTAGTTAVIGTRTATTGTVDANGRITYTNVPFGGLAANQGVGYVTFWTGVTGGTFYGSAAITAPSDVSANAAGDYTVTTVTVTPTST
jgi:hypothetical protein